MSGLLASAVVLLSLTSCSGEDDPPASPPAEVELPYLHASVGARGTDVSGRPFSVWFRSTAEYTALTTCARAVPGSAGWTSRDWTIEIGDGLLGDGMSPDGLPVFLRAAAEAGATGVSMRVGKSELDGATVLRALGGVPWREIELSDLVWTPPDPVLDGVLAAVETLELGELHRLALAGYPDEIVGDPAAAETFLHAVLSRAPHLTELRVAEMPSLSDAALGRIARSGCLSVLDLGECWSERVTDDGIAELARLDRLRVLDLEGLAAVTDETIEVLRGLSSLRAVGLADTQVSSEGLVRLVEGGSVSHLKIGDGPGDDAHLRALGPTELDALTVMHGGATYEGLRAFCKQSSVSELVLVGLDIPSGAFTYLAQLPNLRRLGLGQGNRFHFPYLKECRLASLELIDMRLTVEQLGDLVELGELGAVRELVLVDCRVELRGTDLPTGRSRWSASPRDMVAHLPGLSVRVGPRTRRWW